MPLASRSHYDVLNLPTKSALSLAEVKEAYHKTLLTYHPDKIKQDTTSREAPTIGPSAPSPSVPSIDEIISAYTVLSDTTRRAVYDATLKAQLTPLAHRHLCASSHTGFESYDLEDLVYQEGEASGQGAWSRRCPCGNAKGFVVTGEELEEINQAYEQEGYDVTREVLVGCQGCSLLIRVTFAIEAG